MEFIDPQPNITVDQEENKVVITLETKVPTVNKYIVAGFLIWFVIYSYYKVGPSSGVPGWVIPFVLILGALGAGIGAFIGRKVIHKNLGIRKIIIDKRDRQLESPFDNFSVSLDKIKEIKIVESKGFMTTNNFFKLYMEQGEKTLSFPFTSYTKAEEILKVINDNIR